MYCLCHVLYGFACCKYTQKTQYSACWQNKKCKMALDFFCSTCLFSFADSEAEFVLKP